MLNRTKYSPAIRFVALGVLVFVLLTAISGCEKASLPTVQQTVPKVTTAAVIQAARLLTTTSTRVRPRLPKPSIFTHIEFSDT